MFSAILLIYYIQPSTEYLLSTNRYCCATVAFSAKSSLFSPTVLALSLLFGLVRL